mgnify:FL=1|jgi:putative flippase GtrA
MKKSMDNQTMNPIVAGWKRFAAKHETIAQFLVFFVVSNGVTVLQMIMMPVLKSIFGMTNLVDMGFQVLHCGSVGGSPYYVFDYAAGSICSGGGGGLAYFLAVEITMLIAQVINFFLQRKVTFKSNSSLAKAAFWYVIAYLIISIGAAALQGLYKDPIYRFFQNVMGSAGITVADIVTMIINCAISFWVFFPIFKVIFKEEPEESK